ncbi:MAG TPA: phosphoenolpyruvate--protein phosphotransferase [Gemmatimonadales bacterium]|nr:phosphoenolpyruvate--protein phosphotransferase [Gemmatimonadales bacterium]
MNERLLRGIGVSPGIAYAPAIVVRFEFPDVPDRTVEEAEVEGEVSRLEEAVEAVAAQLDGLRQRVLQRAGAEESRIFDAQILMVRDQDFLTSVEQLIRINQLSAETAYEFRSLELRNLWANAGSSQLRERITDLTSVQIRILQRLLGLKEDQLWEGQPGERAIVVAHELSPGLTVQLDRDYIVGLVSEEGTRTSHAAILAHSLGIPAVMGAVGALSRIKPGTEVLIDGQSGAVLLDPTPTEREEMMTYIIRRRRLDFELQANVNLPSVTPDGSFIALLGNVDLPEEIEAAQASGAEGVGLLRTEFLIVGRTTLPTEDEQTTYFRRIADAFKDRTVIIRTFDLGGDKFPAAFQAPHEANPFLGWRSIRVCLDRPEIFRPQLRAVLRAARDRPIQVMLPLVTTVEEVLESRAIMEEEAAALKRDNIPAAASVPIGVMIETPAAVMIADHLARVSAFFSVGTNDLTQYTLAVDRGNARLANRFSPHHPAVIRQLARVAEVATGADISASVCGEMASDPLSAVLLMGLGYDTLSVSPQDLALIKWVVRSVPMAAARQAAAASLAASNAKEVAAAIRAVVKEHIDMRLLEPGAVQ